MSREAHVRFWESAGVKSPRATHLSWSPILLGCNCLLKRTLRSAIVSEIVIHPSACIRCVTSPLTEDLPGLS